MFSVTVPFEKQPLAQAINLKEECGAIREIAHPASWATDGDTLSRKGAAVLTAGRTLLIFVKEN